MVAAERAHGPNSAELDASQRHQEANTSTRSTSSSEVEQLRSRGRPDVAWSTLLALLKGGIDKKLNELIEVAVADETAEVDQDRRRRGAALEPARAISQIHAALAILVTLALVVLLAAAAPRAARRALARHRARSPRAICLTASPFPAATSSPISAKASIAWLAIYSRIRRRWKTRMPISKPWSTNAPRNCARRTNRLRKIDETRRGFFADISHELRTPLTVIRGEGEIALRGKNKPVAEYKNSIARIVEQAKHLSVLVYDLLFIARQGAGAARLNLQSIDLGNLLEKVCGDAKVIAHPKSVRYQLQQRHGARSRLWRSGKAPPAFHGPARQRRALFKFQR